MNDQRFAKALFEIASDRLKRRCQTCGERHTLQPWVGDERFQTWEGDDGHPYRPMTPEEIAREALEGAS